MRRRLCPFCPVTNQESEKRDKDPRLVCIFFMIVIFITVSVTVSAAVLWNLSLGFQRRCSQPLFIFYVMLRVHWVKRLKMFSSIKKFENKACGVSRFSAF